MTTRKNHFAAVLGAALLGTFAFNLSAQGPDYNLVASVPFAFTAGSKTLPAGEYRIRPINAAVMEISGIDDPASRVAVNTFYAGGNSQQLKPAQLLFLRNGSSYYLYQVWRGGTALGYQILSPKNQQLPLYHAGAKKNEVVIYAKNNR